MLSVQIRNTSGNTTQNLLPFCSRALRIKFLECIQLCLTTDSKSFCKVTILRFTTHTPLKHIIRIRTGSAALSLMKYAEAMQHPPFEE